MPQIPTAVPKKQWQTTKQQKKRLSLSRGRVQSPLSSTVATIIFKAKRAGPFVSLPIRMA